MNFLNKITCIGVKIIRYISPIFIYRVIKGVSMISANGPHMKPINIMFFYE